MHRFSHILGASCVPAVWIMPEWRAVDRVETRKYEDLPIISSSSEIAAVVRGLYNALSVMLNNPLTTIGSYTTHENSPGNSPDFVTPASRFGWPARSRHAVACMHRFSHILRASCVPAVWIMPEWRAVDRAETRKYEDLPIISSSSEIAAVVRGLTFDLETQGHTHSSYDLAYLRHYASYWLDLGVDSNILKVRDLRKSILNYLTLMVDLDFQGQTNFFSNLHHFQGQSS